MAGPLLIALAGSISLYACFFFLSVRRAANTTAHWGPRWLARAASSALYNWFTSLYVFSCNHEEALRDKKFDASKQYLLVWHPHGQFCIAALYCFSYFSAHLSIFPKMFCGVAELLLCIPGLAEYLLICNTRSVSPKSMKSLLDAGYTVGVQPGGIYEQVRTNHLKETVYMPANLGFIRLAINHGVPILPVYAFGENQLYHTSCWLRGFNTWMFNTFKMGSLFVHSCVFGLPMTPALPNPGLCPKFRKHLHVRFGKAVEVGPADANPSDARVQEVYQKYCDELTKLFNDYKDELLPKDVAEKGLDIVVRSGKKKFK